MPTREIVLGTPAGGSAQTVDFDTNNENGFDYSLSTLSR